MTGDARKGGRARNPWGRGERLRTDILEAAGEVLGELGGVDGLTLRAVARHVGVAPASIYAHFPDKSALVDALMEHGYQRMVDLLRSAAQDEPGDARARLRAQVHAVCRYSIGHPGLYRLIFGLRLRRTTDQDPRSAHMLVSELADGLSACERQGARLRLSAERAAIMLLVGVHGWVAISHARSDGECQVLEFADDLLMLVFETPDRETP
jgi:AcrR family transcriptional regulator